VESVKKEWEIKKERKNRGQKGYSAMEKVDIEKGPRKKKGKGAEEGGGA
jgi:hypothetical protein